MWTMTLLKYEPERTRGQRTNKLNTKKAVMVDALDKAIGKSPDGNLRICKALKKPNETVKEEHFHLPSQSRTMGERAGVLGISKADIVAGSWPVFLTGSSSRMHPRHVPLLESDLETQQSVV